MSESRWNVIIYLSDLAKNGQKISLKNRLFLNISRQTDFRFPNPPRDLKFWPLRFFLYQKFWIKSNLRVFLPTLKFLATIPLQACERVFSSCDDPIDSKLRVWQENSMIFQVFVEFLSKSPKNFKLICWIQSEKTSRQAQEENFSAGKKTRRLIFFGIFWYQPQG